MTTSQLGKRSQLGLGFGAGLTGLSFPQKKLHIIMNSTPFYVWLQRGGNGWMALDELRCSFFGLLKLLFVSRLRGHRIDFFKQDIYTQGRNQSSLGVVSRYMKDNLSRAASSSARLVLEAGGHLSRRSVRWVSSGCRGVRTFHPSLLSYHPSSCSLFPLFSMSFSSHCFLLHMEVQLQSILRMPGC